MTELPSSAEHLHSHSSDTLPSPPGPANRMFLKSVAGRALTLAAIVSLLGFLVYETQALWSEWGRLNADRGELRANQNVGYRGIAPEASLAQRPSQWFITEGDQSKLWARWEDRGGHRWFVFQTGDLEQSRLHRPNTIYTARAIDYPVTEQAGGEIWQRISGDDWVAGSTLNGQSCVYPITVLLKTQIVNDLVNEHPFLVVISPFSPQDESISIYDAQLAGRRVTMASTGYFQDGRPLLCDRGTASLWCEDGESLRAVAGKRRGVGLARVAHPSPIAWKTWLAQNDRSRLVIGADRSRGVPAE